MSEFGEEFEEPQVDYVSASQRARIWTERWVEKWLYCPNCGNLNLDKFPNNRPVADFFCQKCKEEFELKSQKTAFGSRVLDGAYRTMRSRIAALNNPNFLFLNYSLQMKNVINLFIVPKHFFVPEILEKRKPLSETARRRGWIGCNIMLTQVPTFGKIYFVRNGKSIDKGLVMSQWQDTLFLREKETSEKGWLIEVLRCVEAIGKREFTLKEVYVFESKLSRIFPQNHNVKPKIRQQLQFLRDRGFLDFVGQGKYRIRHNWKSD
jgi:type II restriction enzyme